MIYCVLLVFSVECCDYLRQNIDRQTDGQTDISDATTMVEAIQYITKINNNTSKMQNKSNQLM